VPLVGLVHPRSPETAAPLVAAFRRGLAEAGFLEGRNVAIEYRYANGNLEVLPALAAELVRLRVDVIAAGYPGGSAAKAATATIPIVFIGGGDPVKGGLVERINRPGGNVTGVSMLAGDLEAKRLSLLHQLVPHAALIGVLLDATTSAAESGDQLSEVNGAVRRLGLSARVSKVAMEHDFENAFAGFAREHVDAVIVTASTFFNTYRDQLVALSDRYALPTAYELREFAQAGGLMSYAPSLVDVARQAGTYVGRVLKGEKPSDMPVLLPTRFEFVINAKTAKTLGLVAPVIENDGKF
jgi:putative tryptophan/tyrosine transport system substrate-binding protein